MFTIVCVAPCPTAIWSRVEVVVGPGTAMTVGWLVIDFMVVALADAVLEAGAGVGAGAGTGVGVDFGAGACASDASVKLAEIPWDTSRATKTTKNVFVIERIIESNLATFL